MSDTGGDRDARIERWLAEVVATCPWCNADVTRVSPRGLDHRERICCLDCLAEGAEGPCPLCKAPITRREKRELFHDKLVHHKCAEQAKQRGSGPRKRD
jgi:hypothetical protein